MGLNREISRICAGVSSFYKAMISPIPGLNLSCRITVSLADASHGIGSVGVWLKALAFPHIRGSRGTRETWIAPRSRMPLTSEWAIFSKCSLAQWPIPILCSIVEKRNTNRKTKKLTKSAIDLKTMWLFVIFPMSFWENRFSLNYSFFLMTTLFALSYIIWMSFPFILAVNSFIYLKKFSVYFPFIFSEKISFFLSLVCISNSSGFLMTHRQDVPTILSLFSSFDQWTGSTQFSISNRSSFRDVSFIPPLFESLFFSTLVRMTCLLVLHCAGLR
jgi:hypothetical protein